MKIFRNNKDHQLYTIARLVKDIKHLNNNANAGIYADPYKWQGDQIVFYSKDEEQCMLFVENNFKLLSEE